MKFNINRISFFITFFLLLYIGCNTASSAQYETDWVKDEILQQLAEIRKEIKSLKADVAKLNGKLVAAGNSGLLPDAAPKEVRFSPDNVLGNENAELAIIEFSDYQCPYCSRHTKTVLPEIKEKLIKSGKVKYSLYDYPLNFHPQAKSAAVAARCAGQQNQYWEMHEVLFKNSSALNPSFYKQAAKNLGLNDEQFASCLKDPELEKAIASNIDYGNSLGVAGTPKFFVGKVKDNVMSDVTVINGAQSFAVFSAAISRLESQ